MGGVERYIHEVSSRLIDRNYHVKIAAPTVSNHASIEHMGKIEILRFPILSFKRLDFSPRMQSYIRSEGFGIVHFHTFEILCRTLRLTLSQSIPYFVTTHGFIWEKPRNTIDYLAKAAGGIIIRSNFLNARRIFCVSRMDCMNVERIVGTKADFNNRMVYSPNGVEVNRFKVSGKEKFKERQGYEDKIVITQIARFSRTKGQHVFLDAIHRVKEKVPSNCVFLLAGYLQDRRYFDELRQKASKMGLGNRLIFFANVSDEDLIRIYKETDIFVLPSLSEGFPLSILEAWASKCSVIATEVGGIPYFAKNGHDSILIPSENAEALSQKILEVVADEALRKRLSTNGYERAAKEFSWDRVVDVITREYDSALEQ